jgi:hypothetical protein
VPIIVRLDVMLARRKMTSRELAARIGISEQNLSLLRSGKGAWRAFRHARGDLPGTGLPARRSSRIRRRRGLSRGAAVFFGTDPRPPCRAKACGPQRLASRDGGLKRHQNHGNRPPAKFFKPRTKKFLICETDCPKCALIDANARASVTGGPRPETGSEPPQLRSDGNVSTWYWSVRFPDRVYWR